jgi:hypothetical protein
MSTGNTLFTTFRALLTGRRFEAALLGYHDDKGWKKVGSHDEPVPQYAGISRLGVYPSIAV